ncbi:hypothetical protein DNTS_032798 [Danionella cerebrum]|uniref:Uncharacterized protein n=1 Tax=Danionella cerebrum TaxID=2873325 RepID=A0A553R806_9TELE|nr:hypothetical protein DNTS_032798 [Danionella translucida]
METPKSQRRSSLKLWFSPVSSELSSCSGLARDVPPPSDLNTELSRFVVCEHLITAPAVGKGGPDPLDADHLSHVLDWKWLRLSVSSRTSGAMKRLVPTRVFRGMSTSLVSLRRKQKNPDLTQRLPRVSVSDRGFALCAKDLGVEMAEAGHAGVRQSQHGTAVQRGALEIIVQRAVLVIVRDEVELRPGARAFNICSDEPWRSGGERAASCQSFLILLLSPASLRAEVILYPPIRSYISH